VLMRNLGRTGLKVAALCLGGNTFGWTTDQTASEAVLNAYAEAGGNFIDTADVYARWVPGNEGGESETAMGRWFKTRGRRDDMIVATKVCGPMGPEPNVGVITYSSLASGFLSGKYRLGRDLPSTARAAGVQKSYMNDRGFAVLEAVEQVAKNVGATPAQVALSFIAHRPGITAPIA